VPSGALKAIDSLTGIQKWEFKYVSSPNGGALSTAGGLVFAGDSNGNFIVLDARTGVRQPPAALPMERMISGR
jgi:alcohol dehydrogenase (cytochrome c)